MRALSYTNFRLQCSQMENQVLESISIIDSPGILSGEKQRVNRGYNFSKVRLTKVTFRNFPQKSVMLILNI